MFKSQDINFIINETINEVLRGFNFNLFKTLSNFKQEKYAAKHLPYIGKGSSRIVFALSGNKVLKIARNEKGFAQNETEVSVYSNPITKNVVTKIYDFDTKNYSWIVSEIAKPFTYDYEFENMMGISIVEFVKILTDEKKLENIINKFKIELSTRKNYIKNIFTYEKNPEKEIIKKRVSVLEKDCKFFEKKISKIQNSISKIENLINGVKPLISKLNVVATDLNSPEQLGITADGRIVLIDYGFTNEVGEKFYSWKPIKQPINEQKFDKIISVKIGETFINLKILYTQLEQKIGFIGQKEPDNSFGLYFKYSNPQTLGFWMKNVPFDLELLAFDENMKLFEVIKLKANDLTIKTISKPCQNVIEVKNGWCETNNIKLGSVLSF